MERGRRGVCVPHVPPAAKTAKTPKPPQPPPDHNGEEVGGWGFLFDSYPTGIVRLECARPAFASSSLWPEKILTPSSIRRLTPSASAAPSRKATPFRLQAANTFARASFISGG